MFVCVCVCVRENVFLYRHLDGKRLLCVGMCMFVCVYVYVCVCERECVFLASSERYGVTSTSRLLKL